MECVSTWPLLQRNKIEDSKINVAVQAIADATIPDGETTTAETSAKPGETPKSQEPKAEPSEFTKPESIESSTNQSQHLIKSENLVSVDVPASVDTTNCVTPMVIDEPNFESWRSRTSERHESQSLKLKRLATMVSVF
jgi:hypothetical protein